VQTVKPDSVIQKEGLCRQAEHASQRGQAAVSAVERLQVSQTLGVGAASLKRLGFDLVLEGFHSAAFDGVQGRRGAGQIG